MLSSYFGEMSILYFAKCNFSYKDLEEHFHTLSVNLQPTGGNNKTNLYSVSHAINLHF